MLDGALVASTRLLRYTPNHGHRTISGDIADESGETPILLFVYSTPL